jgi:pyruvate formate lyase activating enzyme
MPGLIFDIKHYAIHDGPGIRQTIFFKGCPLSCWWCHNPESQLPEIETYKKYQKLDGKTFCKEDTIGYYIEIEELFSIIQRDTVFFDDSGGGVTFSGGEPLMQPDFLTQIAQLCKKAHIHTTLDTSGYAPNEIVKSISPYLDLILYDLKIIDNSTHQKYTGVSNAIILENLQYLDEHHHPVRLRFPVIPGITDTKKNLEDIKILLGKLKTIKHIDILPYHDISRGKYRRFNKENKLKNEKQTAGVESAIKNEFESLGFHATIGG